MNQPTTRDPGKEDTSSTVIMKKKEERRKTKIRKMTRKKDVGTRKITEMFMPVAKERKRKADDHTRYDDEEEEESEEEKMREDTRSRPSLSKSMKLGRQEARPRIESHQTCRSPAC